MKIKSYVLLCLAVCVGHLQAQTFVGNIYLSTQAEVTAFPATYGPVQVLYGNLIIGGGMDSTFSDISDLNGLASIHQIWGSLLVVRNAPLQSLHGLEALDTIDNDLAIIANPQLKNLHGLDELRRISHTLLVENNSALQHLAGLENLHYTGGQVLVRHNINLLDLKGLGPIPFPLDVEIIDNKRLKTVEGMDSTGWVFGAITIAENDSLQQCSGFKALQKVFSLTIQNNPRLTDFTGFGSDHALSIERLFIRDNAQLGSLQGLQNIISIAQAVWIERNNSLQSLYGLDVARIGTSAAPTSLYIQDNAALTDLAFPHLRVIGHSEQAENSHVEIRRNHSLQHLYGFNTLDSCHARIWIEKNTALETLDIPSLRYAYNFFLDTDSSECYVGPFANLEYVEKDIAIYDAKYTGGFPKCKRAETIELMPFEGFIHGFNQLKTAKEIRIGGSSYVVNGFHTIKRCGNLSLSFIRDTLQAFDHLDTIWQAPYTNSGSLTCWTYDNCFMDSCLARLSFISGSFRHGAGSIGVGGDTLSPPVGLAGRLPYLPALTKIGEGIFFWKNIYGLQSIDVFPHLTQVGSLRLFENSRLQSMDGLGHLTKISGSSFFNGRLEIHHHDSIADCSALCPVLQQATITGPIIIENNPFPCASKMEIIEWCDTASVHTSEQPRVLSFELWPNPASANIHLRLPDSVTFPYQASLCDLNGRVLWQTKNNQSMQEITLPPLPAGVYIFTVRSGEQYGGQRLVLLPR